MIVQDFLFPKCRRLPSENCDSSKGWYESDMDSEELQGYVRVHAIYVTLLLQLALKHLTSLSSIVMVDPVLHLWLKLQRNIKRIYDCPGFPLS
jgi:hypothetical protein